MKCSCKQKISACINEKVSTHVGACFAASALSLLVVIVAQGPLTASVITMTENSTEDFYVPTSYEPPKEDYDSTYEYVPGEDPVIPYLNDTPYEEPYNPPTTEQWNPSVEEEPTFSGDCYEGAQKDDGCNICICGSNGMWICTMRACEDKPHYAPTSDGGPGYIDSDAIYNVKNDLERIRKEMGKMEHEVARMGKNGMDVGHLKSLLDKLREAINNVEGQSDPDEAQWAMDDVRDIQNEFWDLMKGVNQQYHKVEMENQLGKQCHEFKREAERVGEKNADVSERIRGLISECERIVEDVKKLLSEDSDNWEVEEKLRSRMEDLWRKFKDIMRSEWEMDDCAHAKQALNDAENGISVEAPRMIDSIRESHPETAADLERLLKKAKGITQEARGKLEGDQCKKAIHLLDKIHFEIAEKFIRILKESDMDESFIQSKFGNMEDDYDRFYEESNFGDGMERDDVMRHFRENDYGVEDISFMKKIPVEVIEEYLRNQQQGVSSDIVQYASEADLDATEVQDLMRVKNELLQELKYLKEQVSSLREELKDIVSQVEKYNFSRGTAGEAKRFIEEDLPNLSRAEAEKRLNVIKTAAREEKFRDGIIPFKDTDDDQWFTPSAARAKAAGLVKGTGESGGANLEPARATNVAEAATLFARLAGTIRTDAVPSSAIGNRLPAWAQPAAGTLEEHGVDLDAIFGSSSTASTNVTRGQIALLLHSVLPLGEVDEQEANVFTDINQADAVTRAAIAAVRSAGIMEGQGDGSGRFGVNDPLNRAELVTILKRAMEQ